MLLWGVFIGVSRLFSVGGIVCVCQDIFKDVAEDVTKSVIRCVVFRSERVIMLDDSGPPVSHEECLVATADDG